MDPSRLRIFLTVHKLGSFTRAARHLYISQPAVSQSIHQLEQSLGARLFARGSGATQLTPSGELLLPYAYDLMNLYEEAFQLFNSDEGSKAVQVRLGSGYLVGRYLVPPLMVELMKRKPAIHLNSRTLNHENVMHALRRGDLDIALSFRLDAEPHLRREPLLDDRLLLAVPPHHPWAKAGRLELDDLPDHPIMVGLHNTATRELIQASLVSYKLEHRMQLVEMANMEVAFGAAEEGLGATFVSVLAWNKLREKTSLVEVPVPDLAISRTLYLVWPSAAIPGVRHWRSVIHAIHTAVTTLHPRRSELSDAGLYRSTAPGLRRPPGPDRPVSVSDVSGE